MTRGNQRDKDRQRSQQRQSNQHRGNQEGLSATQRRERDAQIMRDKLAASQTQNSGGGT